MKQRPILNLILFSLVQCLFVICEERPSIAVHPDTPECKSQGTTLVCEFKDVSQELAHIGDLTKGKTATITKVYIYNIKRVLVERVNCVDLAFSNIDNIQFMDTAGFCRKKVTSLSLYDSSTNTVPRQLNRLEVIRSKIDKIKMEMGLQKLFITGSHINELNIPWPIAGDGIIKIEDSKIGKLVALKLESKTSLSILNSTISYIVHSGLILSRGSSASIVRSVINCEENGVQVKQGAKLNVKDIEGRISTFGSHSPNEESKRPPGVPNKQLVITPEDLEQAKQDAENKCLEKSSTWKWFVPTIFATVEALLLIILWGRKYQGKKVKTQIPIGEDSEFGFGSKPINDSVQHFYNEGQSAVNAMYRRRK